MMMTMMVLLQAAELALLEAAGRATMPAAAVRIDDEISDGASIDAAAIVVVVAAAAAAAIVGAAAAIAAAEDNCCCSSVIPPPPLRCYRRCSPDAAADDRCSIASADPWRVAGGYHDGRALTMPLISYWLRWAARKKTQCGRVTGASARRMVVRLGGVLALLFDCWTGAIDREMPWSMSMLLSMVQ